MKMTLQEIDIQLNQIKENLDQWISQGYTPTVEKDIVLQKLQNVYQALSNSKPVACSNVDIVEEIANDVKPVESKQCDELVKDVFSDVKEDKVGLVLPDVDYVAPNELVKVVERQAVETPQMVLLLGQQISVTQRETFINELFWRDELFFANEIRKFQVGVKSFDEALIYIGEKYSWAANNVYAEQFIGLLENYYK